MKLFLIPLVAVALFGCWSNQYKKMPAEILKKQDTRNPIINSKLQTALDEFIDSMQLTTYAAWPVIHIGFQPYRKITRLDECITLTSTLGYKEIERNGYDYFPYRGKVIGITRKECSKYFSLFIDSTLLLHSPNDFDIRGCYEPYIRVFEVVSSDSLRVVYDGYL